MWKLTVMQAVTSSAARQAARALGIFASATGSSKSKFQKN